MAERQPEGVERLPRKRNRAEGVRPVDVALFADQRVAAQARLDPNLIPLSGHQAHLDQRRRLERLDHAVMADRFLAARVARVRFLLNQRLQIPDQVIAPRALGRRRVAVDDRPIDALGLMPLELLLQRRLRRFAFGEQHQP